jgi:hypothetical protein
MDRVYWIEIDGIRDEMETPLRPLCCCYLITTRSPPSLLSRAPVPRQKMPAGVRSVFLRSAFHAGALSLFTNAFRLLLFKSSQFVLEADTCHPSHLD